jgi:hypothetical protein
MGSSREDFLANLAAIKAASELPALQDPLIPDPLGANVARILRNGLAVSAFASLEDFVRRRNGELLTFGSTGTAAFPDLNASLQDAVTRRALGVLARAAGRIDDPMPLIQAEASLIGGSGSGMIRFPLSTLGWEGSNLQAQDIATILGILGVDDPWSQLTYIGRRCGFAATGAFDAAFRSMASARNAAAHDATANTPLISLRSFHLGALAIACAYDLLASRSMRLLQGADLGLLKGTKKVRSIDIRIRFIEDRGGSKYAEVRESKRKPAVRRYRDLPTARTQALARARAGFEALVVLDRVGAPVWWVSGDMPN